MAIRWHDAGIMKSVLSNEIPSYRMRRTSSVADETRGISAVIAPVALPVALPVVAPSAARAPSAFPAVYVARARS